ncbi:response regulator receiver protein [Pseudoalteromonas ulvae]|uniref:Response regulator receiver protein n=1 Tax=Pseudoalteromonas ulvae TaxID=107327 RepID=A0A244CQU4_PSEDV|nr:response regulator receiver protein [Pseudoalteromonas ulvae]OUL57991.1 response regulator receiver protein [Pseudoalteromonas ulvae]
MILADEIIEILSSPDGVLSEALIKTKVLLHKIGQKELVHWVNKELNGYGDDDTLPDYRIVDAQVLVNASNMAYQVSSHPIPLGHLDEDYRTSLERGKMPHSLAVIEEFASAKEGSLESLIPMEAYGLLGKGLANHYKIQKAWSEIQITSVANILMQVRSRLLDFILELSSEFSDVNSPEEVKEKASHFDAENLFNHTIFGDNTTILVGTENTQKVKNTVAKNDFEALKQELINHGVTDTDIAALKSAIESDSQVVNPEKNKFGPNVKGWLQTMLSKAVDASWQIELGVASSLLATALNNYYGLV